MKPDLLEPYRPKKQSITFYPLFIYALIAVAMIVFLHDISQAEEVTLTWTNPTGQETCSDAGPLSDLAGTRIWQLVAEINDPTSESFVIPGLLPGEYQYVATSFTDSGEQSRISGSATKMVTEFTVTEGTVKTVVRTDNRFLLLPVGTVPLGTSCDVENSVNGHYAVPRDQVTWSGNVQPQVVVAECQ